MHLDSDLLRTFLAVTDTGSILAGASKIHRTQSATSVQIRKLESLLGNAVFVRHGRGVKLTTTGERLEPVARKVVAELDRTYAELRGEQLVGKLAIGIPDEHGGELLSQIIADFAHKNPQIELQVRRSLSTDYSRALSANELDIAVHEVLSLTPKMKLLKELEIVWAASRKHTIDQQTPLPLALFDRDCWWRAIAINSLQQSARKYRIAYSSESASGVAAAVQAGVAVGLLHREMLTPDMKVLTSADGFAKLPSSMLVMELGRGAGSPISKAMAEVISSAFMDL